MKTAAAPFASLTHIHENAAADATLEKLICSVDADAGGF